MRDNLVKQALQNGKATMGTFLGLGSPHVTELLAHAGFDWLVLETEHSAVDAPQVETMLMAMSGTDTTPIVRVTRDDPIEIQRALDIGGMGVLVPMLRTANEVARVVEATRYPPVGKRGFGPLRASRYAHDYDDYLARANDHIIVAMILETKDAVENLDEIAAVPGLDVIFLGLYDLCLSYGRNPIEMPHPESDAAIERALEVGKKYDVAIGTGAGTPKEVQKRLAEGFSFVSYSTDYFMLKNTAGEGIQAFKTSAARK